MARLNEILSSSIAVEFKQIEGFLDSKKLNAGKNKKINIGDVGLNFKCKNCNDIRTFYSASDLYAIGVDDKTISIDCVLKCRCGSSVQMWFLIEANDNIHSLAPSVRILKRTEKFSETAMLIDEKYGDYTEYLEKSKRAARDGLGAGAIVYLRKIFENITVQTANAVPIEFEKYETGNPKNFSALLEKVDEECSIIPKEFTENRKKFFKELSGVVHGTYSEEEALIKFDAFYRLVVGVLDNVKNNKEIMQAIGTLGWNAGGETNE